MPKGHALELHTLKALHPRTEILHGYGTSTVVRLSVDPTQLPDGTMVRTVSVNWLSRPGGKPPEQVSRDIGWSNIPQYAGRRLCLQWLNTKNAQVVTEEAAIGVMALLISNLEAAEILRVLQIGSGGDYLLEIQGAGQLQAESSGIHVDLLGYDSKARLAKKRNQVLTKSTAGFAAITAFSHTATQEVHAYLHYVTAPPGGIGGKGSGSGKRRNGRGSKKKSPKRRP
jgi:hypothetical protein